MTSNLVTNILAVTLFLVGLFISVRAFYTYTKVQSQRVFILGLSMGVIALTAAADFVSSNFPDLALNTDWFLFIGQAVSLLFILLSLMSSGDVYLNRLMRFMPLHRCWFCVCSSWRQPYLAFPTQGLQRR